MQSGNSMIKLENAGLRAPRKMSLGSGLHSQKWMRAPVSKMVGLRAPKQKFQGSRAPGTPPPPLWDPDNENPLQYLAMPDLHLTDVLAPKLKAPPGDVYSFQWS